MILFPLSSVGIGLGPPRLKKIRLITKRIHHATCWKKKFCHRKPPILPKNGVAAHCICLEVNHATPTPIIITIIGKNMKSKNDILMTRNSLIGFVLCVIKVL